MEISKGLRQAVVFVVVVFLSVSQVASQTVVNLPLWADIGEEVTMTCTPLLDIFTIQWSRSPQSETDFNNAELVYELQGPGISNPGNDVNGSRYRFEENETAGFPLTILSTEVEDEGKYWCHASTDIGGSLDANSSMNVRVPPNTIGTVSFMYANTQYTNGQTITLSEVNGQVFTMTLSKVKPAATFKWWLNGLEITDGVQSSDMPDDPYTTSASNITLDLNMDVTSLRVTATNNQLDAERDDVDFTVNLKVSSDSPLSTGAIVGIVIGSVIVVGAVVCVIVYFIKKR